MTQPRLAWDYGAVADAYLQRPAYAPRAIDEIVRTSGLEPGATVADIGAGTGNLTVPLLARGLRVIAIEPSTAMRAHGRARTGTWQPVEWRSTVAESTGLAAASCAAAGFGSSFNVVDAAAAIVESARIVRPGGWIFCLWNHRDLDDPLQAAIEETIRCRIPAFHHGERRADPTAALQRGGRFGEVRRIEAEVRHTIARAAFVEAWQSHLTLKRQAGDLFPVVIEEITAVLTKRAGPMLEVPYVTRAWLARKHEH